MPDFPTSGLSCPWTRQQVMWRHEARTESWCAQWGLSGTPPSSLAGGTDEGAEPVGRIFLQSYDYREDPTGSLARSTPSPPRKWWRSGSTWNIISQP